MLSMHELHCVVKIFPYHPIVLSIDAARHICLAPAEIDLPGAPNRLGMIHINSGRNQVIHGFWHKAIEWHPKMWKSSGFKLKTSCSFIPPYFPPMKWPFFFSGHSIHLLFRSPPRTKPPHAATTTPSPLRGGRRRGWRANRMKIKVSAGNPHETGTYCDMLWYVTICIDMLWYDLVLWYVLIFYDSWSFID